MSQCRMCSQRLTRPGRLCRECERELERARAVAQSVGDLSSAAPLIDAARVATADSAGWAGGMMSRPSVLVVAFSAGLAAAAALYLAQRSHAAVHAESVMIDRDLSNIRPPERRTATLAPNAHVPANGSVDQVAPRRTVHPPGRRETTIVSMAATGSRPDAARMNAEPAPNAATSQRQSPPAAHDRILGLGVALETCSHESFFARIACEQRAKTLHCEGVTAEIPQCAEPPPREYGQ
jgi:hypothetical protein